MCNHRDQQFSLECAGQSHRRLVAIVHNVSWRVAQEERDTSMANAVPPRYLLDLDCYLDGGARRGE